MSMLLQVYYGLPNITNPVMIIAGVQDAILSIEYDIKAASIIPSASLIQWPDAGHQSIQQHCLTNAAIINSWVDDDE
jgi:pimeloyl-ACP methyl ester carboxylesterase